MQRAEVGRIRAWRLRHSDAVNEEHTWRSAADGERLVGKRLDKLRRSGFYVLHSLPLAESGTDIDHLVICPGGVFTLSTKNHPGASVWIAGLDAMVNDTKVEHMRTLSVEVEVVQRMLAAALDWEPPVTGVLVVVDGEGTQLKIKEPPEPELQIVLGSALPDWFFQWLPLISAQQMTEIYDVARWSTTWARPSTDGSTGILEPPSVQRRVAAASTMATKSLLPSV